jgi:hypothetical protein
MEYSVLQSLGGPTELFAVQRTPTDTILHVLLLSKHPN